MRFLTCNSCGSNDIRIVRKVGDTKSNYQVKCFCCKIGTKRYKKLQEALEDWNRR